MKWFWGYIEDFAQWILKKDPEDYYDELFALRARVAILEAAIKKHRAQKADDRCIEDDDELYEALGDGIKCDRRVGSKEEMLKNCARFIENRCEGGLWMTYAGLEKENADLKEKLKEKSDLENFKQMLQKRQVSFEVMDWGGTGSVTVHFVIVAGIGGSHDSCGFAAFHRETGKFQGIYHDD